MSKQQTSHAPEKASKDRHDDLRKIERPFSSTVYMKLHRGKINRKRPHDSDLNDGIDSSTGVNFADVMGMLDVPTKKTKKLLSNSKSLTVGTHSKNTVNEKPHTSNRSSNNARDEYRPNSMFSALTFSKPICVQTLTNEEAFAYGISSKIMRTKIYSGGKIGQVFQVPLLFDLCVRTLQKNIDALKYTGAVPFKVLRPVLERATPAQLLNIVKHNPHLMKDIDCLFLIHVQRNYCLKERFKMVSWREMFLRCDEEKGLKLNSLNATIKQSQKIIAVRKTQLAFVDSVVKPPRNVLRKQVQYGTKAKVVVTPVARVAAFSSVTPNAAKEGVTRQRATATACNAVYHAPMRAKKAQLMTKVLKIMRGRHQ